MKISRRNFLRSSGSAAMGFAGLQALTQKQVFANKNETGLNSFAPDYGPLITDPNGLLDLPKDFSYKAISRTGDDMDDGLLVPGKHDGMGAFEGANGKTIILRNHELNAGDLSIGPFGPQNQRVTSEIESKFYDAGSGTRPGLGSVTTLVYDTSTQTLEKHFLSLCGTMRNCAGGITPWGSWITCEESLQGVGGNYEKDHGFVFEVPATETVAMVTPLALREMGRFNHEAIAVDPASGVIYLTEDRGDGLFYRFIPNNPGTLADGGKLQALKISAINSANTTNWSSAAFKVGEKHNVEWIDLTNVDQGDGLRSQGFGNGAARFTRGEGIWWGNDAIYFGCTDGGTTRSGQIWKYTPSPNEGKANEGTDPGVVELFVQPDDTGVLQNPDNICVAPWGDLIVCEDGSGDQYVNIVTPDGSLFKLAKNATNTSEFAGACFSPDGTTLFVNIQTPGITFAITGPWVPPVPVKNKVSNLNKGFELRQNYPNPIQTITHIPYTLGGDRNVVIDVYHADGRLVKRLVEGSKTSGHHTAVWDATDESGVRVTPGNYLIQIRSGDFTAVKRALVQ